MTLRAWADQFVGYTDTAGATSAVDAAESRGTPATTVAAWRDQIRALDVAGDAEGMAALIEEADGWSAKGNAGTTSTQIKEKTQGAVDEVTAAVDAAKSGFEQIELVVVGLLVLAVFLKFGR